MFVLVANVAKNMIYVKLVSIRVFYMKKERSIRYCILGKLMNFLRVQVTFPCIEALVVKDVYNIQSLDIAFIVWSVFLL